jgi:hypothetical protein
MTLTKAEKEHWQGVWNGKCEMPVCRRNGSFRRCGAEAKFMIELRDKDGKVGIPMCQKHFWGSEDPDQIVAYPEIGEAIRSRELVPKHPILDLDWSFCEMMCRRARQAERNITVLR